MKKELRVLSRRRLFSSAHFYHQPRFSEAENRAVFGRCFSEHGHGHNYILEAFIEGPIDSRTGLIMNVVDLDEILKEVTDPLDHQHLNLDIAEFRDVVPTTENIALYLREKLRARLPALSPFKLVKLRLYETDDLWVEVEE